MADIRPDYYGGADNPYEVQKVIRVMGLNFHLGNALKYMARAGKKSTLTELEDLHKAVTYLNMEIAHREAEVVAAQAKAREERNKASVRNMRIEQSPQIIAPSVVDPFPITTPFDPLTGSPDFTIGHTDPTGVTSRQG